MQIRIGCQIATQVANHLIVVDDQNGWYGRGAFRSRRGAVRLHRNAFLCPLRERKTAGPLLFSGFPTFYSFIRQEVCVTSISTYLYNSDNQELSRPCSSSDS